MLVVRGVDILGSCPSQDSSGKGRFGLGSPNLKMYQNVIFLVIPGILRGQTNPKSNYPIDKSDSSFHLRKLQQIPGK